MRAIGVILLIAGIASSVLYFMNYNLRLLSWMNDMSSTVQWLIRGGLIVLGLIMLAAGGRRSS